MSPWTTIAFSPVTGNTSNDCHSQLYIVKQRSPLLPPLSRLENHQSTVLRTPFTIVVSLRIQPPLFHLATAKLFSPPWNVTKIAPLPLPFYFSQIWNYSVFTNFSAQTNIGEKERWKKKCWWREKNVLFLFTDWALFYSYFNSGGIFLIGCAQQWLVGFVFERFSFVLFPYLVTSALSVKYKFL